MKFFVKAVWDEETALYLSESNVPGLHIEAKTLEQFETVMNDVVGELLAANLPQGKTKKTKSVPLTFTSHTEREILVDSA